MPLMYIGLLTFAVAAVLTAVVRRFALARGIIDLPNARSSHQQPTPRGGGLAIVLALSSASIVLALEGAIDIRTLLVLLVGGGAVALVGFLDDRSSLPVRIRIIVHFGAAVLAVSLLGRPALMLWDGRLFDLGLWGCALEVLVVVWLLNLFNFMDGIDGIAASEAVFVAAGGALLAHFAGHLVAAESAAVVTAAASLGFLLWNWPPAKIFMGDVGSGYLGYVISILMLLATRMQPVMLYVWVILSSVFIVDATVTLIRRLIRGERVYHAHRSHGYQWLSRRWGSHTRVTVSVIVVNFLWLLPCAYLALLYQAWARWIALLAVTPVVLLALVAGAGRREVL